MARDVSGRTLVLLRHAKAEPHGEQDDAERELAPKGRKQAPKAGRLLREHVGPLDVALVSAATRTRQTYELLGVNAAQVTVSEPLYQATPGELIELVRALPAAARTVLVVGHEPTVSSTAAILDGARGPVAQEVRLGISTATACVLRTGVAWADLEPGAAELVELLRP